MITPGLRFKVNTLRPLILLRSLNTIKHCQSYPATTQSGAWGVCFERKRCGDMTLRYFVGDRAVMLSRTKVDIKSVKIKRWEVSSCYMLWLSVPVRSVGNVRAVSGDNVTMLQYSSTPHIIPTLHVLKLTHPQITSSGAQAGFCHQPIHQLLVNRGEARSVKRNILKCLV